MEAPIEWDFQLNGAAKTCDHSKIVYHSFDSIFRERMERFVFAILEECNEVKEDTFYLISKIKETQRYTLERSVLCVFYGKLVCGSAFEESRNDLCICMNLSSIKWTPFHPTVGKTDSTWLQSVGAVPGHLRNSLFAVVYKRSP